VSQRSTPARTKPRSSVLETRKTTNGNLDDGGDKDPTKKFFENYHIVHTSAKRKKRYPKNMIRNTRYSRKSSGNGCR
jgi:hypothetical protein